jgi:hypothetical protein
VRAGLVFVRQLFQRDQRRRGGSRMWRQHADLVARFNQFERTVNL